MCTVTSSCCHYQYLQARSGKTERVLFFVRRMASEAIYKHVIYQLFSGGIIPLNSCMQHMDIAL